MAVLNKWANRIHHVHFKGIRQPVLDDIQAGNKSFLDAEASGVFTVPGDKEDCLDFQAITDRLKAMDYSGWIVVEAEQDPAKTPPYDYSKLGFEPIIDICGRSGLNISS